MKVLRFIARDIQSIIKVCILPIFIVTIVCYVFSNIYVENIPFGVVDMDNSSLSRTIVKQLKNSPGLNVNYYADSQTELEQTIKERRVSGGVVIPKDFNKDAVKMKSPSLAMFVDGTNIVVANNIYAYGNTVLGTVNAGFQLKVFEGNNMLPDTAYKAVTSFSYGERALYETRLCYMKYFMYTLAPYFIQGNYIAAFIVPVLIANRKKLNLLNIRSKKGLRNILDLVARILMVIVLTELTSFITLCILDKCFDLPLRGNLAEYFTLMFIFLIDLTALGFFFAAFIDNILYIIQFINMFGIITFLASGVAFPRYMMPDGLPRLIESLWPFMNVALQFKNINLKGVGWDVILPSIKNGVLYAIVWFIIGIGLYSARIALDKHRSKKLLDSENEKSDLEGQIA
ncbi:ABC transporter [Clostridium gelidum]|uniref:ABC transporter n=1 Tax=Clostridium gelidum TaxID=704125 RepID=A0ABN6IV74_9CLOT|nr:ABC transporter permease [Clostridium gelidum]BCZ44237.1 ABC transporter [Clostridium gelidum]